MTTKAIAKRLVALCRKQQWEKAQTELYADTATSTEPAARPGFPKVVKGLPKILQKGRAFGEMVEQMHSLDVSEAIIAGNVFACTMTMDCTMKGMGRAKMAELCVYHAKDGKIVAEEFFFSEC